MLPLLNFLFLALFIHSQVAFLDIIAAGVPALPEPTQTFAAASSTNAPQQPAKSEDSAWKLAGEVVDVILKILGAIAAFTWTVFTFLKERKLKPRLEPKVSGKVISGKGTKYALLAIEVKNPGSSKVDLDQFGTALLVYSQPARQQGSPIIAWEEKPDAISILEDHDWIEPGETISESVLIPLNKHISEPLKLILRVNSQKVTWEIQTVIESFSQ